MRVNLDRLKMRTVEINSIGLVGEPSTGVSRFVVPESSSFRAMRTDECINTEARVYKQSDDQQKTRQ